ncbi:DUF3052 family protein [Massilia sp. P8910]|uniref:DUF3052 family protein n=1 Tax=Massilia antarctica TaxID=2765360 RepID=UPI0006BB606D|nr:MULTISPECIES: DUF3052 family protein [Massilia]MCE3605880.1 DUF3052 family protein [Massilia antarctica]MCY0910986.1 DUF3052 family protein [Massilia sp. H27-R4]CUI09781.1 hypothetical protein BN2497_14339 [Janthinobacterium sp. CG23_2]CUU33567.1 hypothetical protein BN3177_14339 [Janthinobacterium sp. CG23_2]
MSEKTIADKMYLKTARSLAVFNGAVHPAMMEQLPKSLINDDEGPADVVLVFALNQAELEKWFPAALQRLGEKGSLWVAYLKPSAPKATDITRDSIFAWAKEQGVTGVAMVSMDSDWSAVRLKRL